MTADRFGTWKRIFRRTVSLGSLVVCCAIASCDSPSPMVDAPTQTAPTISLELSVREDGTAATQWTEGIAIAIGEHAAKEFEREHLPLTPDARAWLDVLKDSLPLVEDRTSELGSLFDVPPLDAVVVVGNRGSSDGFGWVPDKIGINVQAFTDTYGPPTEGATNRMVRITAHEYLHLVTYAFYADHAERRTTPIDRALWTMFFEGIGDYVSVSSRWLPDEQGIYSSVTANTLEELEPIFVRRLESFLLADSESEEKLRSGIAMGKFDEKWGSLPIALWLHSEVKQCGEPDTLRKIMRLERDAVLLLALRHISPELRPRVAEIQKKYKETRGINFGESSDACLAIIG